MRSKRNKKQKIRYKKKRRAFVLIVFVIILISSVFIYGENAFYAIKTYLYRNQASKIDIEVDKSNDLENINLNFKNIGSCDVYLRGFVFVYENSENNSGTIISNDSIKINYGDKDLWYVGDDNYIYYTKQLKAGDATEKTMVKSIEIELNNEEKKLLTNDKLDIDIVVEAVQVNNFAYKYQWDMENTNLEELFNNEKNNEDKSKEVIQIKFN